MGMPALARRIRLPLMETTSTGSYSRTENEYRDASASLEVTYSSSGMLRVE